MSFILDALRKSDQQRSRNATPTLTAAQAAAAEPRPPVLWWYGLIAVVLVGAGVLIGWMQRAPAESPAVAGAPSIDRTVERTAQQLAPAPVSAAPETVRKSGSPPPQSPAAGSVTTSMPAPVAEPKQATTITPLGPVATAGASNSRELAASKPVEAGNPIALAPREAPPDSAVLPLSELPPALQQEIPKLSILAHSYSSKPKARFVFINDRMVHEEEYPLPGLKLEQITPDGMIFSYKGYRFRRAATADPR